ncbi:DUF4442 domain-containing protein [Umezawaea beigongshangensis]|uniref:DUF4442 domain-containing protein n=1 Tax=Umezawaea beigongshangensis TaxID=2780383 RepID=UPI0018F14F5E|nr:DUF4442 domain-containing protein [Umezawaea beigongshangensis]
MSLDTNGIGETMKKSVPWVGTSGVEFAEVSADRVVATLPDAPEVHNHVGGPHAAMMFGVGETASGAIVVAAFGEHLGRAVPLVVRAEIAYRKVAHGPLRAEAVLGRPVSEVVAELDAGTRPEFPVRVTISNAEGVTTGEMTVLWTLRPHR